jgi:transposase-like protein
MNPSERFCPHPDCPKQGQIGAGNLVIHSQQEHRYRCKICKHTFAETQGTPYYRLRTDHDVVTLVVTLLAHGCPLQAIVVAFGFDERTVAAWGQRAGRHCRQLHEALLQQGQLDLQHVQADELWVKVVGGCVWMAMALAVPFRLWLGGEISPHRDGDLIRDLVQRVRQAAKRLDLLVCVDGFASYVTAFCRAFRVPVPREPGQKGKSKQVLAAGFRLGQVIKQYAGKRVCGVVQRAVCGTMTEIVAQIQATGGQTIHTAYCERLNATFRSRLVPLIRRGRALARQERGLWAAMYLVGCVYNFCTPHRSLRQARPEGAPTKWQVRTPAMAAGLTDHVWSVWDLLHRCVPPKPRKLDRHRSQRRRGAIAAPAKSPPERRACPTTV